MQPPVESCLLASSKTYNPSLIVLRKMGYEIWLEEYDNSVTWCAKKGVQSFRAYTAPELLGIVVLWEQKGGEWNQQQPDLYSELLERMNPERFKETKDAIRSIEKLHGSIGYNKDGRLVFTLSLNFSEAQKAVAGKDLLDVRPATDADMATLCCFKDAVTLDLSHTHVTDEGLRELKCLRQLGCLSLEGAKVTDAGLKELACHTNLGSLYLAATHVSGSTFRDLATLSNLEILELSAIPGTPYSGLACLPKLRELCLCYGDVTVADLKEISLLVNLRRLELRDMNADWVKELAQLNKRRTMSLYETRLSESRLGQLKGSLPECNIRVW